MTLRTRIGAGVVCVSVMVHAGPGVRGAEAPGVVYHNGFESAADMPRHQVAASSDPVLLHKAIVRGRAHEGTSSLVMTWRMRRGGYFYPMFPLPTPIPLDAGPLYLSGYVKIEQQHPEASHHLGLGCAGAFPVKKAGVWGGLELRTRRCVETDRGWLYFYSDELQNLARKAATKRGLVFKGAYVSTVHLLLWRMRPSEVLRFRLDNVRLTRHNPVPPPDEGTHHAARELYGRMCAERTSLVGLDPQAGARLSAGLDEAARIVANRKAHPDRVVRALLVGKVRELERPYWRLKLLRMAAQDDR